ncbi:S-adenosyl-L-methionine-dependent methyltransferase [Aspergillus recurvatus]
MGDTSETYPLARDSTESTRLNNQHSFIVEAVGGLIDSAVPLENITSIADVGTGTGIWLHEVRDFLKSKVPNKEHRTFHGFDISAAQFPDPPPKDVSFSCQDILKPFPPEHHGRYDLVHVRLLVTAFPEKDYETAVRNLVEILKPGGFIQWTDLNCASLSSPTSTDLTDPRSSFLASTWLKFLESKRLAVDAPASLTDVFEKAGLADVRNTGYPQHDCGQALKIRAQKWQADSLATVVERLLSRNGNREADSKRKVEAEIAKLWEYFEDGGRVLGIRFGVVVERKAA